MHNYTRMKISLLKWDSLSELLNRCLVSSHTPLVIDLSTYWLH